MIILTNFVVQIYVIIINLYCICIEKFHILQCNVINFTGRFTKGIYAISVAGRLPPNFVREMKARGIPYRPRDTTFK